MKKRFCTLPNGADFYLGDRLYFKSSFCTATPALFSMARFVFVAPWRKVRTTETRKAWVAIDLAQLESQIIAQFLHGKPARDERNRRAIAEMHKELPPYTPKELIGTKEDLRKTYQRIFKVGVDEIAPGLNEQQYDLLLAQNAVNTDKTEAYAEELRLRYLVIGARTGYFHGRTAPLWGWDRYPETQPHKDDERTGPSA